ncbi:MAG: DUF4159 domain-containing protein [Vicinamibacterales bacterium]
MTRASAVVALASLGLAMTGLDTPPGHGFGRGAEGSVALARASDAPDGAGQFDRRRRQPMAEPSPNVPYDARFTFVRLRYTPSLNGFGFYREVPWHHDYPRADSHFMKILDELTYLAPHLDGTNIHDLRDPELCNYPVAYMSEPGFWTPEEADVTAFRQYLLKGGFAIFDDFRGRDWENFAAQMRRVLPNAQFVPLDVSHPVFHSFFEINSLDFVSMYDRGTPIFYGVFEDNDPKKRLVLIANFNNDIGEYWEFSDTGYVPIDLSNEAYKLGVNYVIYAMTH